MLPLEDHGSTRSAINSHCSSVKSPCADRQVATISAGPSPINPDYAIQQPNTRQSHRLPGTRFRTASQVGLLTVSLAALEDIIASKEFAGRDKDLEGLPELRELRQRKHN